MLNKTRDLDAPLDQYNLLKHSFYTRWTAGTLTRAELQDYAGQYSHVVAALPRWLAAAAASDPDEADTLLAHSREESAHLEPWARFAESVGVSRAELDSCTPNEATASLLRTGDELASRGQGAAVAWALEVQTPAVSIQKLRGLAEHYGIDASNGGAYFALHSERDIVHAAELRSLIEPAGEPRPGSVDAADATLGAMWGLLSSVEAPA